MTTATFASNFSDHTRLPDYLVQLLDRFPVPGPDQELRLVQKAKNGHETSLTWLIVGHVRLVSKIATKYAETFEDGQDLLQEGMLGIRHAVRKFDPTKGYKFSTYARGWIQGYIRRFCYKNRSGQLRLPEKKQIHLDRVKELQSRYPELSLEDIAHKAKLKLDYVEDLLFWGLSFQESVEWQEFPYFDDQCDEDDEVFECGPELKTKANIVLIKAPQLVIPPKPLTPIRFLKQWFRVGVEQLVSAAKSQVDRTRIGFSQASKSYSESTKNSTEQERLNLSTWPASLPLFYSNSISAPPSSERTAVSRPTKITCLAKGALAHAQKSLVFFPGRGSDGPADRSRDQSSQTTQRCRELGAPRGTGRGHLGFCQAVTQFFHRPLASISQSIRGFAPRDGPASNPQKRKGAVFEPTVGLKNSKPPQTFIHKIPAMYKTLTAMIAVWLGLLISPAAAESIKIAPGHGHLIDLTASGCRVSKAYMGTRGIFDLSLDQPQPQTQKIYLTWKPDTQVKSTNLILDLVGCNRSSMELVINRSDSAPKTAITRIGGSTPVANAPAENQPVLRGRLGQPPAKTLPPSSVAAVKPLTLQPTAKATPAPKPKIVKRPPVRRLTFHKQVQTVATANRFQSDKITPTTILRGLNVARSRGEISYQSAMHSRVNSMIRAMRRGSEYQAASKRAGVPTDVVQALISYGQ